MVDIYLRILAYLKISKSLKKNIKQSEKDEK
jgi:hypothetical protein